MQYVDPKLRWISAGRHDVRITEDSLIRVNPWRMASSGMLRRVASVLTRATRHNIPEEAILHSHRHENLKSYRVNPCFPMHYQAVFVLILVIVNTARTSDPTTRVSPGTTRPLLFWRRSNVFPVRPELGFKSELNERSDLDDLDDLDVRATEPNLPCTFTFRIPSRGRSIIFIIQLYWTHALEFMLYKLYKRLNETPWLYRTECLQWTPLIGDFF
jgi:hypothetical protein